MASTGKDEWANGIMDNGAGGGRGKEAEAKEK